MSKKKKRKCQGCGSENLESIHSPRADMEWFNCKDCGHRSFYFKGEKNVNQKEAYRKILRLRQRIYNESQKGNFKMVLACNIKMEKLKALFPRPKKYPISILNPTRRDDGLNSVIELPELLLAEGNLNVGINRLY